MENEKFQEIVIEHLVRLTQSDVEIKGELGLVKDQVGIISDRLDNLETIVLRIENDHGEEIQALIDAHEVQLEIDEKVDKVLIDVNKKVDGLDKKVDGLDKKVDKVVDSLQRIEGKVDLLTLKVSEHDTILGKAR